MKPMTDKVIKVGLRVLLIGLPALFVGCSSDLFTVTNPGRTLDSDLNDPSMVPALVAGMAYDFSAGYDNDAVAVGLLSDELAGTGNYEPTALEATGVARRQDFNFNYESMQQARWDAETGIERMKKIKGYQFDGNALTAEAYLQAGMSNRVLGELFCQVTYNDSAAEPRTVAFQRALPYYQAALTQAQAAGDQDDEYAALGGLAQTYFDLGDGANAVKYSVQVPTDYLQTAYYSTASSDENNQLWSYSFQRNEISVYNTYAAVANDPRAPWTDCRLGGCVAELSADGSSPQFRQDKYNQADSPIPVMSGAEMRLIEAEVDYQNGQLTDAVAQVNEERAFYGLPAATATTATEVFQLIDHERFLVLWLSGRRLFDLDRWNDPFLNGGTIVRQGVADRARCFPLSETECDTNPAAACQGSYQ